MKVLPIITKTRVVASRNFSCRKTKTVVVIQAGIPRWLLCQRKGLLPGGCDPVSANILKSWKMESLFGYDMSLKQ